MKDSIKDYFLFGIVKPSEEEEVLFSSRECRLLILVKTDYYYYICLTGLLKKRGCSSFFSQFLIQETIERQ